MNLVNIFENYIKKEVIDLKKEANGQGAAEYILLFGGVIVIAIAALLIYNQYFTNTDTGFNASSDVKNVRDAMNST